MIIGIFFILLSLLFLSVTTLMVKERNRTAKYKGLPSSTRTELIEADERLRRLDAEQKGKRYTAPPKSPESGSVVFGILTLVCLVYGISKLVVLDGTPASVSTQAKTTSFIRPSVQPAKFRVFRQPKEAGDVTAFIVASDATQDQLISLLWVVKDHVGSNSLSKLGLKVPDGFSKSGVVKIFKSVRCASEDDLDVPQPCGSGEHSAAFYQWGGFTDAPDKDLAASFAHDGSLTKFFGSEDVKTYNDFVRPKQDSNTALSSQDLLMRSLNAKTHDLGYDMTFFPGPDKTELVISSEMFEHDGGRVTFLSSVLPEWRTSLCSAGFTKLTLDSGSLSLANHTYSVQCKTS